MPSSFYTRLSLYLSQNQSQNFLPTRCLPHLTPRSLSPSLLLFSLSFLFSILPLPLSYLHHKSSPLISSPPRTSTPLSLPWTHKIAIPRKKSLPPDLMRPRHDLIPADPTSPCLLISFPHFTRIPALSRVELRLIW